MRAWASAHGRRNQGDHLPVVPDSHYAGEQKKTEVRRDIILAPSYCTASVFPLNQNHVIKRVRSQTGPLLRTLGKNDEIERTQNRSTPHSGPASLFRGPGPKRIRQSSSYMRTRDRRKSTKMNYIVSHDPHTPLTAVPSKPQIPP